LGRAELVEYDGDSLWASTRSYIQMRATQKAVAISLCVDGRIAAMLASGIMPTAALAAYQAILAWCSAVVGGLN
jgi:hypothetical protein